MIGRLHHLILDCRDPRALAAFRSAVLGQPVTFASDDFCVVSEAPDRSGLACQRTADHLGPRWPDESAQLHLDVMVDDVEGARPRVEALGARLLQGDVYAAPAGHPFCLIPRPGWAPPVR